MKLMVDGYSFGDDDDGKAKSNTTATYMYVLCE